MTSLSQAFEGADASSRSAGAYAAPNVGRYEDNVVDEAERRYAYEQGRQRLYAKSPPHHNMQHPVLSSQESFRELQPVSYGEAPPNVSASCSTCQRDMCCSGDGVFCSSCNRQSLEQHAAAIPSLYK
jgi:hypothetical protein